MRATPVVRVVEPWHGTTGGYTNHKCRCTQCRNAHRKAQQNYRDRHPERNRRTGRITA